MRVTLKLATSLDGRIATASGESRWITDEAAREQVHRLRAEHDVVLVGVGTVLADDPELTVRLPGWSGVQPARAVLDTGLRTPVQSRLVQGAGGGQLYLFSDERPRQELADAGVKVLRAGRGRPEPAEVLAALTAEGFASVFIEGGGQVAASFLRAGLIDRLEWFRAPLLLGADGVPAVADMALETLTAAPRFRRTAVEALGPDLWERYERA